MSVVFADAVQVTFDRCDWRALRLELLPLFDHVGLGTVLDQPSEETGLWRLAAGGTVKVKRWPSVVSLGAMGQVLESMRLHGLLNEYLAIIGTVPHKVTRLDATVDIPVDAAPVLRRLVKRARTAPGLSLSRKRIPPAHVETSMGLRADGVLSGTAYFGLPSAPVRLCAYDKQKQRMDVFGMSDATPCLRLELRLRNGLPTLRDASEPASIFWHYMDEVLPRPAGVPAWAPALDPFRPERVALDPDLRLRRRVETSGDLAALVRLADSLPGGRADLYREIAWAFPVHAIPSSEAA